MSAMPNLKVKQLNKSILLDMHGAPMRADFGGMSSGDYSSGSRSNRELGCWNPLLKSADRSMLGEKDLTEGRARDLIRNNGFAKGALQNSKDRIVGDSYILQLRPMYKLLGISKEEAAEWGSDVEQKWKAYANDPECWIDAARKRTFTQILREEVGVDMMHGEIFVSREWKESGSMFNTCFQSIEPERCKTPPTVREDANTRGGIKHDNYGEALGYWFRTTHRYDVGTQTVEKYDYVPKKNEQGFTNIIHLFEPDLPNQTRGFSPFASVIKKLKMLDRLGDTTLEAAIIKASIALVMTSDAGNAVFDSLASPEDINSETHPLSQFDTARSGYNEANPVTFDGAKVHQLFPGDKLDMTSANITDTNFAEFESALLREVARGFGMSYEELSGDYTKTTYASARAAMQIAWEYVKGRRAAVTDKLATLMFRAWLDEAIVKGVVSAKDYWKNRSYWTNCSWIGAGRLILDDVKAQTAYKLAFENHTMTLAQASAEQGFDLEENIEQIAYEKALLESHGLASTQMNTQVIIQDGLNANE